jgi:hypothetical protein
VMAIADAIDAMDALMDAAKDIVTKD